MLKTTTFVAGLLLSSACLADLQQLAASTNAFVSSLSPTHRAQALYPLETDLRATWSNLPTIMAPPAGVLVGDLSDEQRRLVHEMLRESLSSQGYLKVSGIMWLDDYLRAQAERQFESDEEFRSNARAVAVMNNRSSGHYAVAVFGTPGEASWGWKITGHHLAINVTVSGTQLTIWPGFFGSNPRTITTGPYAGFSVLASEMRHGLALLQSLDDDQRKAAIIGEETPEDVIEGPGRRGSLTRFEGLQARHMNLEQLGILQRLVGEHLRNAAPGSAGVQLDSVRRAGWNNVWFSWRGPTDGTGRFYYRVHGPRLLIEYNLQTPDHDHAVVRDPENDYGEDWLGHHYKEVHPSYEEYMGNLNRAAGID